MTIKFKFPHIITAVCGQKTPQVVVGDRATSTFDDVYYVAEILADDLTYMSRCEGYDADFEAAWRSDEWRFVGVQVRAYAARVLPRVELASASIWGVESVSVEYLCELAEDLSNEMRDEVADTRQRIVDGLLPPFSASRWGYAVGANPGMQTAFSAHPCDFAGLFRGGDAIAFIFAGCIDAPDSPLNSFTTRTH